MGTSPLKALSNFQIEDYYKGCKEFGGCPCNDEIAAIHDPKKFYIVNMSSRKDGGSHWTLLFQNLYFDSFGCQPTLAVKPFVNVWNNTPYQDFHSSACGFYCIYVADNLLAGRPPETGLIPDDYETPTHSSEHVLRKYFSNADRNDRFQSGSGFFQRLVDRFKPRKAETGRLRKFLDGQGSQEVVKMEIARFPIIKPVRLALNIISLGRYNKKKKELGYDDVFHQYTLVTLKDGSRWRVEKNHVVEAFPAKDKDYVEDRSNVPLTKTTSLNEMISIASKDDPEFWRYDSQTANCQDFTRSLLQKNGLTPEHLPDRQDAQALVDSLPHKGLIPKLVTDAAAYGDQLLHGSGLMDKLWKWY